MKISRHSTHQPSARAGLVWWCGLLAVAASTHFASAQIALPTDVKPTCTVTPQNFATWFQSGTVQPGGIVKPADSATFPNPPTLCDFYQWSEQMFLWFTSPVANGHVFDSPLFFNVSTADPTTGHRTLEQNGANTPLKLRAHISQLGPHGQPVMKDAHGQLFERVPLSSGPPGQLHPDALVGENDIEFGQATSNGVLISQGNSLVYYAIQVNDVYARFLTGQKSGGINPAPTNFPTKQADLDAITKFAGPLSDLNAMAIEIKTSWVDASTVDKSKFVTMSTEVPTFDKSDPAHWKLTGGSTPMTLALVGLHFVGSVAGHPELIWATFEHNDNSPLATYSYTKSDGSTGNIPQSTQGNWLFCGSGAAGPFNVQLGTAAANGDLFVFPPATKIAPSNTLNSFPWGSPAGPATDPKVLGNNTAIISLNESVHGMLPPAADVRSNYLLMGATWTTGVVPSTPPNPTVIRGSTKLANSTMETYSVGTSGSNCFDCHSGTPFGENIHKLGLTHIYFEIQPLSVPPKQ